MAPLKNITPFLTKPRLVCWILGILILASIVVVPLWIVEFPPLLDYPNHLARSFVLIHLHDPAFNYSRFYRADWGFYPYLGMDAILVVLERVFPIETAGRVFLSLCTIAVPAAALFFIRAVDPAENATALWSFIISYNVFFLEGFLNFDLSIAMGFLAIGIWLRWIAKRTALLWIAALLTFTALYFAHLLGFGIAGFVVLAYLAVARKPLRDWIWSIPLFLPSVGFYFIASRVLFKGRQFIEFHDLHSKLQSVMILFQGHSSLLPYISLAALAIWFIAAWWHNPEFRLNGRWLAVTALLFIFFLSLPWIYGEGADLDIRVLPFAFIALFAAVRAGRRAKWLAIIPVLAFALRTVDITRYFVDVQPQLAGIAHSFDAISRNALVFPIVEADEYPIERPYTHFWAYGVIRRGFFSPYLFDIVGQTPMRITYDSYTADGFWDLVYKEMPDWKQVQRDYDYVWDYKTPRFSTAIMNIGNLVYSYGDLEVYRIKKIPEAR